MRVPATPLLLAPNSASKKVQDLLYGEEVQVLTSINQGEAATYAKTSDWIKVQTQCGSIGYTHRDYLLFLNKVQVWYWQSDYAPYSVRLPQEIQPDLPTSLAAELKQECPKSASKATLLDFQKQILSPRNCLLLEATPLSPGALVWLERKPQLSQQFRNLYATAIFENRSIAANQLSPWNLENSLCTWKKKVFRLQKSLLIPSAKFSSDLGEQLYATAEKMVGTPFQQNGNSFGGTDDSGLIYLLLRAAGWELPRQEKQLALLGKEIKDHFTPGDLLFFRFSPKPGQRYIAFLGLYLKDGLYATILPNQTVTIRSLDPKAPNYDETWAKALRYGKRIFFIQTKGKIVPKN